MGSFRKHDGKGLAAQFRELTLLTCDLTVEADLRIPSNIIAWVGPRDAGTVAATRELGLARLVSTDSDFAMIPERRAPREFLLNLHGTPRPGDG